METETRIQSQMLGSSFGLVMKSVSWVGSDGQPRQMQFVTESEGRRQTVLARFSPGQIQLSVDNNGERSTKTLTPPAGAHIVDDPTLLAQGWRDGQGEQVVYVLDPVTLSLIRNTVVVQRNRSEILDGKAVTVDVVEVRDPRATSRVLLSPQGELVRIFGPMGMEMRPEPEAVAKQLASGGAPADLGFSTRLRTDRRIDRPEEVSRLVLDISGIDLARLPQDAHQKAVQTAEGWRLTVTPVPARGARSAALGAVARQQPEWVKPDSLMPSDQANLRQRARRITAGAKTVAEAAERLRLDVYQLIRGNTSIAVLRNANEVLATREGLCRDHAILLGTLLRAAGIPARLCAGLVYDDDAFFYHAWVEYWDGAAWVGLDSTRPSARLTATHIKLAQGRLEDAFQFLVLDGAKLKVVNVQRASPARAR